MGVQSTIQSTGALRRPATPLTDLSVQPGGAWRLLPVLLIKPGSLPDDRISMSALGHKRT
jgi:hypothetical protein